MMIPTRKENVMIVIALNFYFLFGHGHVELSLYSKICLTLYRLSCLSVSEIRCFVVGLAIWLNFPAKFPTFSWKSIAGFVWECGKKKKKKEFVEREILFFKKKNEKWGERTLDMLFGAVAGK